MDFNEYQDTVVPTAIYPEKYKVVYPVLGLCGEAGEVAEKVKKIIRDAGADFETDSVRKQALLGELGDVLWYLTNLANDLDFKLEDVAQANVSKVLDRLSRNVVHGDGDNR